MFLPDVQTFRSQRLYFQHDGPVDEVVVEFDTQLYFFRAEAGRHSLC